MSDKKYYGNVMEDQRDALRRIETILREMLRDMGADATLTGRIKSFGSICRKMRVRGISYLDVLDAVGVRVVFESVADCYRLVERIEWRFEPVRGRKRDYIVSPKSNGYQSLHTTVRDDWGIPIEIQVRTYCMHERSETGPAAHILYKLAWDEVALA